jgi:hypothetical protein
MNGLVLLSLPFAAVAAWSGRTWSLAVPLAFWLGFAALEAVGLLPGTTEVGPALVAGLVGSVFAGVGLVARQALDERRRRGLRPTTAPTHDDDPTSAPAVD